MILAHFIPQYSTSPNYIITLRKDKSLFIIQLVLSAQSTENDFLLSAHPLPQLPSPRFKSLNGEKIFSTPSQWLIPSKNCLVASLQ